MYSEDDLLPISALQHLAFCERQWGLIHLEGVWEENPLTAEGGLLHERAHEYEVETRQNVRIVRGLSLRSLRLGLTGRADVVEFHRLGPDDPGCADTPDMHGGTSFPGVRGLWKPFPVEYKRGSPKSGRFDDVQLCAQAMCLEEMRGVHIPEGALFYGETRRRHDVRLDPSLRERTEELALRLHELTQIGRTPTGEYGRRCESCSIKGYCLPRTAGTGRSVRRYIDTLFKEER